jgi:2-alkyl-3-oxoalkanoate reductase
MKVWVAGGSGVIGRCLIELLTASGHCVVVASRSPARQALIRDAGAEPVVCDALDADALTAAISDCRPDIVVNQLTALPARIRPRAIARDLAATNRLRSEGARNLMRAARAAGVRRVVAQSVAFAYAPGGNAVKTEDDPLYLDAPGAFSGSVRAITDLERVTLGTQGVSGVVLRYGYLYGPGTHYAADGSIAADVRKRRFPVVGSGSGVFSFVHVTDAARATLAAIETDTEGAYNIVDDEPAPVADWLPAYASLLGAPAPRRIPLWLARMLAGPYGAYLMTAMPGASNARARESLAWRPEKPTWRDAWAEEFTTQCASVRAGGGSCGPSDEGRNKRCSQ